MSDLMQLPLRELAARIARREVAVEAAVRASIERIEEREPSVHAWQYFDPELALAQAHRLDRQAAGGPLYGLPIGVKDLMDTADMPTTYGSPVYAGHRPRFDAACVAASRAAGAVVMGKTVTTEFATFQPGPTRNPRAGDIDRTPGGSSSGSAAAVAAGMVRAAFGTQTAGSIIRPAAFCGVVGYKPTHGTLPLAGIRMLSPSLDTVGVLARTVDDAAYLVGTLARLPLRPERDAPASPRLRVGICHTPHWDRAGPDARRALAEAARLLERAGAQLADVALPSPCEGLTEAQIRIMGYEGAAAFAPESATAADGFSPAFAAFLAAGQAVDGTAYAAAQALAASGRNAIGAVFERVDILLVPSAEGEAPAGLASTGDPIFSRLWTLLGNPCVHVPLTRGASGMPVGVTLVGPRWADAATLAVAQLLESQSEPTIK
jgi:Asp-tRNA(Asn)/Glu-tRNA(Gln) amidotransferase A subunit family amidase